MTIQILPDLAEALQEYAAAHEVSYGSAEPVVDLVPAMLASFLESDREFQKTRRQK